MLACTFLRLEQAPHLLSSSGVDPKEALLLSREDGADRRVVLLRNGVVLLPNREHGVDHLKAARLRNGEPLLLNKEAGEAHKEVGAHLRSKEAGEAHRVAGEALLNKVVGADHSSSGVDPKEVLLPSREDGADLKVNHRILLRKTFDLTISFAVGGPPQGGPAYPQSGVDPRQAGPQGGPPQGTSTAPAGQAGPAQGGQPPQPQGYPGSPAPTQGGYPGAAAGPSGGPQAGAPGTPTQTGQPGGPSGRTFLPNTNSEN